MSEAVNYARHDALGHYVFHARGEKPDPAWLNPLVWAWFRAESEGRRLAGLDRRYAR